MKIIAESELVLNADNSVYHLKLRPEHISDTILIVGDQGRVDMISSHFTNIECKIQNREFVTHTGTYNGKRITALSTGIGTDNIDIVINELDALANIDLENRTIKETLTSLNIVRLGTSGALQENIPVDSFVMSEYGLGFDGLLNFYKTDKNIFENEMTDAFVRHTQWAQKLAYPYIIRGSELLMKKLGEGLHKGITATASGFYGPQGRQLRIEPLDSEMNEKMQAFNFNGNRITNFEMETSALYGLGSILGHQTLTICAIIANRVIKEFSKDYKKSVEKMVLLALERITQ